MKWIMILAICLATSSLPAKAEDLLFTVNGVGGLIVTTDQACKKEKPGVIAKTTNESGIVIAYGCALAVTSTMWKFQWDDGRETYIDMRDWQKTNAFNAVLDKAIKEIEKIKARDQAEQVKAQAKEELRYYRDCLDRIFAEYRSRHPCQGDPSSKCYLFHTWNQERNTITFGYPYGHPVGKPGQAETVKFECN